MHFIHQPYVPGTTVAAISTAPGEGGIAVIRISGKEAITIVRPLFSKDVFSLDSHVLTYGTISRNGHTLDTVLLVVMRAPKSFTGEDTVEIHCHGGRLVTEKVLEAVLESGAQPAKPGEFSFKAFMNGKIDLAQAEAIQALIGAKNEQAMRTAQKHLEGALSKKILHMQDRLIYLAAIFEAWVDFPEEGLEFQPEESVIRDIEEVIGVLDALIKSYHGGKIMKDGVAFSLVGSPNVGKSSLMNAILGKDRAIVSSKAGTTRDLIEEDVLINGIHVRLIDTAGIRNTEEEIEQEGIRRSKKTIEEVDLVLCVLDSTKEISDDERALFEELPQDRTIAVWNKIDELPSFTAPKVPLEHVALVSAKESLGLEDLYKVIEKVIWQDGSLGKEGIIITSLRHKTALLNAKEACVRVIEGLRGGMSSEFIAFDMRDALNSLGILIGRDISEDILTSVFTQFCIGK